VPGRFSSDGQGTAGFPGAPRQPNERVRRREGGSALSITFRVSAAWIVVCAVAAALAILDEVPVAAVPVGTAVCAFTGVWH